jgi:hypothetical protein
MDNNERIQWDRVGRMVTDDANASILRIEASFADNPGEDGQAVLILWKAQFVNDEGQTATGVDWRLEDAIRDALKASSILLAERRIE